MILAAAIIFARFVSGRLDEELPFRVDFVLVLASILIALIISRTFMLDLHPHAVPVLYYHSIHDGSLNPVWDHLSCPVLTFRAQMTYLKTRGYNTITLDELHDHVLGKKPLEKKSVVISFDDGFLDNWVYAFPVLRRLGLKGTIFMSTDFIDTRAGLRPTAEDAMLSPGSRLESVGYLSAEELRAMSKSGVIEFQSHAKSHTWVFSGSEIADFHHPNDEYFWLDWNHFPQEKPYWLSYFPASRVPLGTPVFTHTKALEATRFIENPAFASQVVSYVEKNGRKTFFSKPDWKEELKGYSSELLASVSPGRFETDEERDQRLNAELAASKKFMASTTGSAVNFLAWPGGGKNDVSIAAAIDKAGYTATAGKWQRNRPGDNSRIFTRIGAGAMCTGKKSFFWDVAGCVSSVEVFRGNYFFYPVLFLVNRVKDVRNFGKRFSKSRKASA